LSDKEAKQAKDQMVQEKGFFMLPSHLFCNVLKKAEDDENLNMTLESVFTYVEESAKGTDSEEDFAGLFDDFDVNVPKMNSFRKLIV
jgi:type I restriction enzyme M protein